MAEAGKVQFELVSPERLLISEPVDMVVVPGAEGYFGVLPGHAPLISTLRPGVIEVYQGGQINETLFVAGGFAEVTGERCTVLADQACRMHEIDIASVDQKLVELEQRFNAADSIAEKQVLEQQIEIEHAKRRAAGAGRAGA